MSAYIVSEKHIDVLVWAAFHYAESDLFAYYHNNDIERVKSPNRIGTTLLNENIRSVNTRYGEDTPYCIYQYRRPKDNSLLTPAQVFRACDCYEYQACETHDYHSTKAASIIDGIRRNTIRKVPGYDNAIWGIE